MSTPDCALAPASLLQLIWLASPALPVGGFYYEGPESFLERSYKATEMIATEWPADQLHLRLVRGDEIPLAVKAALPRKTSAS